MRVTAKHGLGGVLSKAMSISETSSGIIFDGWMRREAGLV